MKRIFFSAFIFLISSILANADIYIRERVHKDSFYDIGTVFPAETETRELWIGNKLMAYITQKMIVIIDKEKSLVSILNQKAKTYVKSPLPLDVSKISSQDLFLKIRSFQINGKVKKTGETTKIEQKNCDIYKIILDFPFPKEMKIWATLDVPFDWKKVREMQSSIWKLNNYSADFIRMLETIKGYWMISQESLWMDGTEEKKECKALEIIEKNPPDDVYTIPAGYIKVEKLTLQDFGDLGIAIYVH
jgi:hypothetical protein